MIVVRVELWSANEKTEMARMHISNVGGTEQLGDYDITVFRGRGKEQLDKLKPQRTGKLTRYPRLQLHVWNLVMQSLLATGYGKWVKNEN